MSVPLVQGLHFGGHRLGCLTESKTHTVEWDNLANVPPNTDQHGMSELYAF